MKTGCPKVLPLKTLLPFCAKALLPSQKKFALTDFPIGIIKTLSIMPKIFVSTASLPERLMPVERSFFAALNALSALPATRHAGISKRNAVHALTKLHMSAMDARNRSTTASLLTNTVNILSMLRKRKAVKIVETEVCPNHTYVSGDSAKHKCVKFCRVFKRKKVY